MRIVLVVGAVHLFIAENRHALIELFQFKPVELETHRTVNILASDFCFCLDAGLQTREIGAVSCFQHISHNTYHCNSIILTLIVQVLLNPLDCTGNYRATPNNMKLVYTGR